jgi:sugar lactone lactonase YvrE
MCLLQAICLGKPLPKPGKPEEGRSFYQARPDDPRAVYFTPDRFPITTNGKMTTDGKADVSDALQQAINEVKSRYNFGILFIPEGIYRISKTIYIPTAVRLIGFGKDRPVILLGKNAPGFQAADPADKGQGKYMFWFVSSLSAPGEPVHDAGASTFYSALSNINLKIEAGNPQAVALRTHFAQHSFIAHVDMEIGDGKAGMFDVGNEMEDVRFFGGDYGIYTTKPSPGWPFMMVDTYFEGQRKAAIRTQEAGLTIVRMSVKNVPAVIDINANYQEKLFMEDCRFDKVMGPAIIISNEDNAVNQVSLRNIVCRDVPILIRYRRSEKQDAGAGQIYKVKNFISGLQMDDPDADPSYKTIRDLEPLSFFPAPAAKDIPDLPAMKTWVNLQSLGAKGDGVTDDTRAIQQAIDLYPTLYFPQGRYLVSETIRLKPNTVLIGLNPIATQLLIADNTPAFGGFGGPVPLLEAPRGGTNIVTSIGLSTGASNPRAVACKWMAGAHSYMNDVKFVGGHGGLTSPQQAGDSKADGSKAGDPKPGIKVSNQSGGNELWDTQYWSLWITDGGGGTFKDIWTANTYASAGTYISNTSTPGRIYSMSVEHHVRNEIRFNNVANWKVYALQLEEESWESSECQPMELENCRHLVFANLYMFRVIRVTKPYPWSIRRWGGGDIELLNVHNYSQIKYTTTTTLYDVNTNREIRPWEFARLYFPDGSDSLVAPAPAAAAAPAAATALGSASAAAPDPQQLATGFEFVQSPCSDSRGNIYFCESRMRRIYKWSAATRRLSLVADYPWEPLSLACDKKDNLLVVFKYVPRPGYLVDSKPEIFDNPPDAAGTSFSGWGNSGFGTLVYSIDPANPDETIRLLSKAPMGSISPIYQVLYPAHRWRDFHDFNTVSVNKPAECWVAPDGVTIIPAVYDLARSAALAVACPGQPFYTSDEYDKRTVQLQVSREGMLSGLTYFAERGEFASVVDAKGRVYIADGDVYVYDAKGQLINRIRTPERPTGIYFGADKKKNDNDGNTGITSKPERTLYITGHHSFYSLVIQ